MTLIRINLNVKPAPNLPLDLPSMLSRLAGHFEGQVIAAGGFPRAISDKRPTPRIASAVGVGSGSGSSTRQWSHSPFRQRSSQCRTLVARIRYVTCRGIRIRARRSGNRLRIQRTVVEGARFTRGTWCRIGAGLGFAEPARERGIQFRLAFGQTPR